MSRNFELLQNLGRERDIFATEAEELDPMPAPMPDAEPLPGGDTATAVMDDAIPAVDVKPSQPEMEASQKDELNKLVQAVFLGPAGDAPRTVVVASTEAGNGSSWVCARVAEILASHISDPVCVVDANLRTPRLHDEFRVENHHGLSNALRENGSVRGFVRQVGRANLWLLSCGSDASEWSSLVGSERMSMRIAELRREFRYVLIDGPALSSVTDSVSLGRAAEGVILVLKANASRREVARKAVQELQAAKVRVLGAILNHRTFPIPDSIYNRL